MIFNEKIEEFSILGILHDFPGKWPRKHAMRGRSTEEYQNYKANNIATFRKI